MCVVCVCARVLPIGQSWPLSLVWTEHRVRETSPSNSPPLNSQKSPAPYYVGVTTNNHMAQFFFGTVSCFDHFKS